MTETEALRREGSCPPQGDPVVTTALATTADAKRKRRVREPASDTFGSRLAAARKKAGLSQWELAHLLGASESTVRNWEHGRAVPHKMWLGEIVKALKCRRSDLVDPP